jgi:hypothetical protein
MVIDPSNNVIPGILPQMVISTLPIASITEIDAIPSDALIR